MNLNLWRDRDPRALELPFSSSFPFFGFFPSFFFLKDNTKNVKCKHKIIKITCKCKFPNKCKTKINYKQVVKPKLNSKLLGPRLKVNWVGDQICEWVGSLDRASCWYFCL